MASRHPEVPRGSYLANSSQERLRIDQSRDPSYLGNLDKHKSGREGCRCRHTEGSDYGGKKTIERPREPVIILPQLEKTGARTHESARGALRIGEFSSVSTMDIIEGKHDRA